MADATHAGAAPPTEALSVAYRALTSRSRELYTRALCVLPGGNTRHSIALTPYPVYAVSGRGCVVTDADGEERIDFLNNLTSLILGHAHPAVVAAVHARVAAGTAFAGPTEAEVELAELIAGRVPSIEMVRFCNSGSEAVILALKAARAFTGRPRIAKFEGCYHGLSDYVQVSERPAPDAWGPPDRPASVTPCGTPPSAAADVVVLPWNDAETCERLIEEHGDSLAAVLLDPLPVGLSMIEPRPGFLRRVSDAARRAGVLLVADEVLSYRVGYHGACHEQEVRPDLTCLGKIIGGGFPVGALGGRRDVMSVFDLTRAAPVLHGGTYNANPVTMVAGLTTLRLMTPDAFAQLEALGDRLRDRLRRMLAGRGIASQVFGRGSLFAVRFTAEPLLNYRDLQRHISSQPIYETLCHELLARGMLTSPRGVFGCLSTPMTELEVDAFVDALDRSLTALGPFL